MRWKSHVRFGGRTEKTDRSKDQHRASVRPLHLRLDVVGLVLHRVRHRRLRPHPGLVGRHNHDQPTGARCCRAGDLDPAP